MVLTLHLGGRLAAVPLPSASFTCIFLGPASINILVEGGLRKYGIAPPPPCAKLRTTPSNYLSGWYVLDRVGRRAEYLAPSGSRSRPTRLAFDQGTPAMPLSIFTPSCTCSEYRYFVVSEITTTGAADLRPLTRATEMSARVRLDWSDSTTNLAPLPQPPD